MTETTATLCDIVIPIWDQPERTRRCLEALVEATAEPVRLILIDNGSRSPTREYLERFKEASPLPVLLIRNEENLGFIKATNQGIRAGDSPWICLLNNDTVVTAGWLAEMIEVAESGPEIGLVNPTSNSLGFDPGKDAPARYAENLRKNSGQWEEMPMAVGFCLLARRSLMERVGGLDESFGMGNFEDAELSRQVKRMGLRCVRACGAYVYHEEKASFRELPGAEEEFRENRKRFEERWGRPLRILWVARRDGGPKGAVPKLAAQGHWLCFAAAAGAIAREISSCPQVTVLRMNPALWRIQAALRLLLKRKKPFDLVISEDPRWSRWIGRIRRLHRAEVLSAPTEGEILERCREISGRG